MEKRLKILSRNFGSFLEFKTFVQNFVERIEAVVLNIDAYEAAGTVGPEKVLVSASTQ